MLPLKILTLGDSITYGVIDQSNTDTGGYRTELFNSFAADNFSVDFVGSVSSGPNVVDRNNEGHRGWRIDQIAASVDGWLSTYQPDMILLMIGTNDILQDYALSTAPDRLSALIDQVTTRLPSSNVLVASIPPTSRSTDDQQQVISFNSSIPGIVDSKVSQGKNVSFVDIFNQLTTSDLADRVHPTAEGYNKIATAWHDAILPFTTIKQSIRIQAEDMTLTNYRVESGNYSALGQEVISLYQAPSPTGTASLQFNGPSGMYDIVVGYFDENDGQAQLSVRVGGQIVDQWTLNQNLGSASATAQARVRRTIAAGQTLNQGATIEIQGTANLSEFARVDYIEFIPIGQILPPADSTAPTANLLAANLTTNNGTSHTFNVTYNDNVAVDVSSLDSNDVLVTGSNNFNQLATFVSVDTNSNGNPRTATYRFTAPGGSWDSADNGTYMVTQQANQVKDTSNNFVLSGNLGSFQVNVAPTQTLSRLETEDMQLTNYRLESGNSAASGSKLISLYQATVSTGTATSTFNGPSGMYDIVVGYFDENDGQAQLSVRVGGQIVDQWTLNQNLGSASATAQARVRRTIAAGQTLNQGATIEIQGTANLSEFARVDYIEFIPIAANPTPGMINGTEAIDTLTGSTLNDTIYGFGGNDTLNGSAGNDTLIGGVGNDRLYGGVGLDMFVLSAQQGSDTITDFVDGQDRLGLSNGSTFNQLTITQGMSANVNDTLITLTNTGELLAKLSGVQANTITIADFSSF